MTTAGALPLWNPGQIALDLRSPTLVSFVDMARWLAAMLVMVSHLRAPLLLGFGDLPADAQPLWVKLWYFVTGMHSQAVIVFFVLSGFLVGGLAAARLREGRFDPPGYAIDRFARLYIAFLPALALTLLVDTIGNHWFSASGLYDGTHPMIAQKDAGKVFADNLGWLTIVGNVLMLQQYFVPPLGSNVPLWTLSNEFWFYAVFGLAAAALLARRMRRWLLAGATALACTMLGLLFLGYFGLWLIGFIAAGMSPVRCGPPWLAALALAAYLAAIRAFSAEIDASLVTNMASHYGLALVFGWLLVSVRGRAFRVIERLGAFNRFMADFSYSLYLIHYPLLLLVIAMLGHFTGIAGFREGFSPVDPVGIAFYLAIAAFVILASWIFAQLTERHTAALRGWLKRRLRG